MGIYLEWARPWPAPERERGAEFQGRRDATPLRNVDWVRIVEMEVFGYCIWSESLVMISDLRKG